MSELSLIRKPIEKELKEFESHFKDVLKSPAPLLDVITNYILRRKGKQIRPSFVLLTASMLGGVNNSSYTAASLIELLHTASLVHDDVVDDSYERRGFFSLKALWKSKVAVLVGDYLLAQGLLLSVERNEYELLAIVSEAVKEMSEGELMQIRKARKLDITEKEYFEIIEKKTAALIAACTACGAKSVNSSSEVVAKMKEFGKNIGIAFQIKDDLFDYNKSGKIGKPAANDIKEKKMTLPLIYALQQCPKKEKNKIIRLIRTESKNGKRVDEVIAFVKRYGGIDHAQTEMKKYSDKANLILEEMPKNESATSLNLLVQYTINRSK
jgi:octaprenyl-diphosphate synthase